MNYCWPIQGIGPNFWPVPSLVLEKPDWRSRILLGVKHIPLWIFVLYIFLNVPRNPLVSRKKVPYQQMVYVPFSITQIWGDTLKTRYLLRVKEKERISGANRSGQTWSITNVILFIAVIITTEVMEFLLMIFPCMKEKWWGIHTQMCACADVCVCLMHT